MFIPGEIITIKARNPLYSVRNRYANSWVGPEFTEYTGTVVREDWHGEDRIGLTTDIRGYPVRVLSRANIVEVSGAKVEYQPAKSSREVITVQGSKGQTYVVTKENGKAACTCPGYGFRKSCKHVQEALSQ